MMRKGTARKSSHLKKKVRLSIKSIMIKMMKLLSKIYTIQSIEFLLHIGILNYSF